MGRYGLGPLSDRQYGKDDGPWPSALEAGIDFFILILPIITARPIDISGHSRKRCVLYTDASWEISWSDEGLELLDAGLGTFFISAEGSALAFASQLNDRWLPILNQRKTQIVVCEALAILDSICALREEIRGNELLIFCDNIAVVCALVKGVSNHRDIQGIMSAIHAELASLSCRWWVEWVPTDLNPADGPSRDAFECSFCASWGVTVQHLPDSGWTLDGSHLFNLL